jgi:mono/diheme cytochrome c family protein
MRSEANRSASVVLAAGLAALVAAAAVLNAAETGSTVTPVLGPSTLRRLGLKLQQTAMGWTGRLGPGPDSPVSPLRVATPPTLSETALLTGADLYRLNCHACHRADGSGAPEEVNSIVDPIRATSPVMVQRRMEATGRPISAAFARQLARGARQDVVKRLENGGERMPSFGYFSRDESDALLAYVEWLAGVPGASQRQLRVAVTVNRVGEHLVKGTCHICHDATGSWPDPVTLLDGAMPPLAGIVRQRTIHDVLTKVRHGKPVVMGVALISYRGRMPVFDYLTDGEVSAAYGYLSSYPPQSLPRRTDTKVPKVPAVPAVPAVRHP